MVLYEVVNPEECGLVETDETGRVTRFHEKPPRHEIFTNRAFTGVMMCDPKVLEYIPDDTAFDFGGHLMPALLKADMPLYAEPIMENEFVIDIGTLGGYLRALQTAAIKRVKFQF
jgi:NDP-sugar pyrophosphorylase family protein